MVPSRETEAQSRLILQGSRGYLGGGVVGKALSLPHSHSQGPSLTAQPRCGYGPESASPKSEPSGEEVGSSRQLTATRLNASGS